MSVDIVKYQRVDYNSEIESHLPKLISELIGLALANPALGVVNSKTKLAAIQYLLDRYYGRPSVEVIQRKEGKIKVTVERVEGRTREEYEQRLKESNVVEATSVTKQ